MTTCNEDAARRSREPSEDETAAIAARLHAGQFDLGGKPYIAHPLRVRDNLGPGATPAERKGALLHDVLEDCRIPDGSPEGRRMTPDDLRAMDFGEEVIAIVVALTNEPEPEGWWKGLPRAQVLAENDRRYRAKIDGLATGGNVSAMRVKVADNLDNADPSREGSIDEPRALERVRRLRGRYEWSILRLSAAIIEAGGVLPPGAEARRQAALDARGATGPQGGP